MACVERPSSPIVVIAGSRPLHKGQPILIRKHIDRSSSVLLSVVRLVCCRSASSRREPERALWASCFRDHIALDCNVAGAGVLQEMLGDV